MNKIPVILAIHGINTGLTDPMWPWKLQAYAVNKRYDAAVQTDHYKAGPWPWWNILVKNPRLARAYAKRLDLLDHDTGINIVAHSNGTDIAMRIAFELRKMGRKVDNMILIGGAIESDIEKSGIMDLVGTDNIGQVVCYCSKNDHIVERLEIFKGYYGSLGFNGLRRNDGATGLVLNDYEKFENNHALVTRWFPEFGHSGYFEPENAQQTFRTILSDLAVK